jgi:hypothetical protein
MSAYPAKERQNCGYAIRYSKALLDSDAMRHHGRDTVLLVLFIVGREDRLHYKEPPKFWRSEIMERFAIKSPKDYVRIRNAAVNAGLLHYVEGSRIVPSSYWTLTPRWLFIPRDPFPKRNESGLTRSQNGTDMGTDEGTDMGTLSIPYTQNPKEKRSRFIAPTVQEVRDYCLTRRNSINADQFVDHYTANGWTQGKGKPIRDWQAAVRTWERNGIHPKSTAATVSRPNESDRIPRAVPR